MIKPLACRDSDNNVLHCTTLPSFFDLGLVCKHRRYSAGSFPRESSFSPIFFALTATFIYPSTGKTHKQPHATNHRSFRFTVWLLFLRVSNYTGAVYIASLLQIFCWIRRPVKSAGSLCPWRVYSLVCSLAFCFLMFCAAVSSPQAVVLKFWTSSGGCQTPKRGETVSEEAVPFPGCVLCMCAHARAIKWANLLFRLFRVRALHKAGNEYFYSLLLINLST